MSASTTSRRPAIAAGVAAACLVALSACGADDLAERGIEELAESEAGGDVDIDLDSGEFSIESEDGSMTMDEDGNFVITDESGEVIVGDVDDDGNLTVESEDGSFSAGSGSEIPDDWPSEIPRPDALAIDGAVSTSDGDTVGFVVTGQSDDAGFVDTYGAALESAGFSVESEFTSDGTVQRQYESATWGVSVGAFTDGGGPVQVTVTVFDLG